MPESAGATAPGRPRSTARRVAVVAAQAAVAALLLFLVWRLADGPDAARILTSAQPGWLALAALLLVAHTTLAALRWRVTAAPLGISLTRGDAISEYFLAQLVNTTLPGGVLGDAGRAARSRHQAGLGTAAGAVIIERAIGQLSLLIVLGAAFVVTLAIPTAIVWPIGVAVAVAVAAALITTVVIVVATALGARRARTRPRGRLAGILNGVRRSVAERGVARAQAALSAGTTLCILGAFGCCAIAVGAPLPVIALVTVVPVVLFAMLLPISIGGWGVREGAAVALLPIAGVTAAEALAMSVAFGLVGLAAALPGIVPIWARKRAPAREAMTGSDPHPPPTEETS